METGRFFTCDSFVGQFLNVRKNIDHDFVLTRTGESSFSVEELDVVSRAEACLCLIVSSSVQASSDVCV